MFSDFKSRGFGITETQKEHADRLERLILVMALAMYWSTSAGMSDETPLPKSQKNASVLGVLCLPLDFV